MGGRGGPVRNGDGGRVKNVDLGSVVQGSKNPLSVYGAAGLWPRGRLILFEPAEVRGYLTVPRVQHAAPSLNA